MSKTTLSAPTPGAVHTIEAEMPYVATTEDHLELSYLDRDVQSFTVERRAVPVIDARRLPTLPTLEREGFLLANHVSATALDTAMVEENAMPRDDVPDVNDRYAEELIPLIQELTGARDVFPQYGTAQVRFSNRAAARSWLATAGFAHVDFVASQVDELVDRTITETGRTVKPYRRQRLIQTWRVITDPPQDMPLAVCDSRSVSARDLIPMDFHGVPGSRNELIKSRVCQYGDGHRWHYYPDMTPQEVLVFSGYDSDDPDAVNVVHTSFDDATVDDAVPRGSIECRFIALYD